MTEIALKIDIQTILKMVKFDTNFRYHFKKLSFIHKQSQLVDEYVKDTNIISKNVLWGLLSTIDNILEVNYIIDKWRTETTKAAEVEKRIELLQESSTGHTIVGKVVQFDDLQDKYKKLIQEGKKQNFQYNGFKIMPYNNQFLQLFF